MQLQEILRAKVPADLLKSPSLFAEEDPWTAHGELLSALLEHHPKVSKPELRTEIDSLLKFHGRVPLERRSWVVAFASRLRKLLSKIQRTARQMKTGERLPQGMVQLTRCTNAWRKAKPRLARGGC